MPGFEGHDTIELSTGSQRRDLGGDPTARKVFSQQLGLENNASGQNAPKLAAFPQRCMVILKHPHFSHLLSITHFSLDNVRI